MSTRLWFCSFLAALALAVSPAFAQTTAAYPEHAIRMVVPFPPGGGADSTARLLAQKMGERLGQSIVVENKPGANGLVGTDAVAKAPPDGYTLLLTDRGALGINPSLYTKLPYDPRRDFAYIGIATDGPYVLVVSAASPAKTLAELVTLAKAKPGAVRYGSYGIGSMAQLNLEALANVTDIQFQHIPYKGAPPAVAAVVAGEVDITIASPPSILGLIKAGRVRALAVGSDTRLPLLPDVPTMAEAGVASRPLTPTFFALAAPAGTPATIVDRLNAELRAALNSADVAEKLRQAGLVPNGGTPIAMHQMVVDDIARFATLAKQIGIKPE